MDKVWTLTQMEQPEHMIASGYGSITYREWCEREMKRMNDKNDDVYIHEFTEWGQIALVRGKRVTV